jgi:hypothetical protein
VLIHKEEINTMKLIEIVSNLSAADRQSRKGLFYDPKTLQKTDKYFWDDDYFEVEAVVAEHGQEPDGYLLFCDCSLLGEGDPEQQIARHCTDTSY